MIVFFCFFTVSTDLSSMYCTMHLFKDFKILFRIFCIPNCFFKLECTCRRVLFIRIMKNKLVTFELHFL